ncbi:hypothetical protein [uncultured Shewanella sp.]|uniref:hypothetical protein n=1 Tax=Shewanella atlantica TaxID=271099 RepID=UPI0026124315|nr:hypothetical protein [uncultured Shewanella sp.]
MDSKGSKLDDLVANLPREMTPEHDLWGNIDKRLDAPISNPGMRGKGHLWRNAALAGVLLTALLLGQNYMTPDLQPIETNAPLINTLAEIKFQHDMQIAQLQQASALVNWRSSQYSSPVETGIEQLREAARQLYESLQRNPTDKQLWQLWLWTQHREIELLRQGQKLPVSQHSQGATI